MDRFFRQVDKILTSTQGLTQQAQGLFSKHDEAEEQQQGFQDLLSHLQGKQPSSLAGLTSNLPKPAPQSHDQVTSAELKMKSDLIEDEAEAGWGINDDDLILDDPVPVVENKKEPVPVEKKRIEEEKKPIEVEKKVEEESGKTGVGSRPSLDLTNKFDDDNKPPHKDSIGKNQEVGSRRKLSSQFKDLKEKATGIAHITKNVTTGITKNVAETFLWKKETPKAKDTSDIRRVFDNLAAEDPTTPPHYRKAEADHGKESHAGKEEHTREYKDQLQRYMAQAHQLELLIKTEQDMLREEYGQKIKDLQRLQEEATARLEICETKERELRTLDEKIKLKETLSFDEAHLDKIAVEIQDAQEKISNLEEKNQFLEISLKKEQERLQGEMQQKLEALRSESDSHFAHREIQMRTEHERAMQERAHHYEQEIVAQRKQYRDIVEKIRAWAASFQEYKKKIRASMIEVEEILWARGEEYESSTQILKDFQEKVVQLGHNYKAKLEQKDKRIAKLQETEKTLHDEILTAEKEKNQQLSAKEKEMKELKNQYQKLEKAHGSEKEYLVKAQSKIEDIQEKYRELEERLKASEREKNEVRQSLENEKRNANNLQERIDELSQKGKDVEGTTKTLEKTSNEMKKTLEKERKKVLELQSQLDAMAVNDKQNDSRVLALEKKNEEFEEILDKEKSKSLALQLKFDEAEERSQIREKEIEALRSEKNEVEERYTNELKSLKSENYNMESSYMKEIEAHLKEIKSLKASKEDFEKQIQEQLEEIKKLKEEKTTTAKPIVQTFSNKEAEKRVNELSHQIEMMNKEKIQLIEKYKKEKAEIMSTNDEKFKSVNFYIQEVYAKNHELGEENTKLVGKFNKLKEKLIELNSNFKNLGTHPHGSSPNPKTELRQLLAHFNILSGPSSDAAPETPSKDDFKEEHEDFGRKVEKIEEEKVKSAGIVTKGFETNIEEPEVKSAVSSQKQDITSPVIPSKASPLTEETKKFNTAPQSKSVTVSKPASQWNIKRKSANNVAVQKPPVVKELPPNNVKEELQTFLDQNLEVQEGGWGNADMNLQPEINQQEDKQKRPKSTHERVPSFSEIDSPTNVESGLGLMATSSISQENTPRQQSGLRNETVSPQIEVESPKFESQESPRFESRDTARKSIEIPTKRTASSKVEDYESPTFEGKKLGDYVKTQNDSFSNLDEKGGEGWDIDIDVQDQREDPNSPTFEQAPKTTGLESPTFKVSGGEEENLNRSQRGERKSGLMEEVKMSISPGLRARSPSFSNYGEDEPRERKDKKADRSHDNSMNLSRGIVEIESPKFMGEEDVNEPRFGGSTENAGHSQKGWGMEVDLTEENRIEPRFGGSVEEAPVEQPRGWGFDDDLGVNTGEGFGNLETQKNKSSTSAGLKSAGIPEKLSATNANKEPSLGVQGGAWGFEDDVPAIGTPELKPVEDNQEEAPLEVEGGWDNNIEFEKPAEEPVTHQSPTKVSNEAQVLSTKAPSDPFATSPGIGGGWDVGVDLDADVSQNKPSLEISTKQKSPVKVSEQKSDPFGVSPGLGGGWDVGVDLDADLPAKQKSPTKTTEKTQEVSNKTVSDPMAISPGVGGGWDVDVDFNADISQNKPTVEIPAKQKSPVKVSEPKVDPFGVSPGIGGGWDVGVDLDADVDVKPPQVSSKGSSVLKTSMEIRNSQSSLPETDPNRIRAGSEQVKLEKENKLASSLDIKQEAAPLKSAGKLGPAMNFDLAGKKPTAVKLGGSDEKKDAPTKPKGLVINKVFLPAKKAGDSKATLGKPKDTEPKDEINLEEFLGSSLK